MVWNTELHSFCKIIEYESISKVQIRKQLLCTDDNTKQIRK